MPNNSLLKQFSKSLDAREKGVRVKKKKKGLYCVWRFSFAQTTGLQYLFVLVAMRSEAYKLWSSTRLFITALSPQSLNGANRRTKNSQMECITDSSWLSHLQSYFKRVSKASVQEGHKHGVCLPVNSGTTTAKHFSEGLIENPSSL